MTSSATNSSGNAALGYTQFDNAAEPEHRRLTLADLLIGKVNTSGSECIAASMNTSGSECITVSMNTTPSGGGNEMKRGVIFEQDLKSAQQSSR